MSLLEQKISLVRNADAAARSFDSRIKQVTVIYRDSLQRVRISTSDGFISEDDRIYTTLSNSGCGRAGRYYSDRL